MSKKVISVRPATTLRGLLRIFSKFHRFPLVPVVEDDNRLIGIISFRNLINVFLPQQPEILKTIPFLDEEKEDIFKTKLTDEVGKLIIAEDIMEKKFIFIQEDVSLEEAYNVLKLNSKEELPVVDKEGHLVGMIGIFDIIREVFHQQNVI